MALKNNFLVEKQNVLNDIRSNNMSLQELRFFSIYLAKINPRDMDTRVVRFSLVEFQKIMEIGRTNINHFKFTTDNLLCKIVKIPRNDGGYDSFQLFKKCSVGMYNGEWYVEINAHDESLPLMFEFKNKYFTYQLWNALRLKSSNQLRMYEILKQYEKVGERILKIDELRELLGIGPKEYLRYNNFKSRVLDSCQKALEENTDIKFTYEPFGRLGSRGKILELKFNICKNEKYLDPLSLDDFIDKQKIIDEIENEEENPFWKRFYFLKEACQNEFNDAEFQMIYNLVIQVIPNASSSQYGLEVEQYDYLKRKYDELKFRETKTKIKSRFSYFKTIIEADLK